jgi:hypothetical protein
VLLQNMVDFHMTTHHYGSSTVMVKNFHFSTLSRPALGSTQPPIQCVLGAFPGGKAAWA